MTKRATAVTVFYETGNEENIKRDIPLLIMVCGLGVKALKSLHGKRFGCS